VKPERGQYRSITVALLDGPDFQALPAEARWVFTCLKIGLGPSGIEVVYPAALVETLAARTGYTPAIVGDMLDLLQRDGWVKAERHVVWVVKQLEFEPAMTPKNEKHREGVLAHVKGLPRLGIVAAFIRQYQAYLPTWEDLAKLYPKPSDSLSVAYGKGIEGHANHRDRDGDRNGDGNPEVTTATQSAGRSDEEAELPPSAGQVMAAVRKVLWAPDGVPPADWSDGREMSVIKALLGRGETADDLIRAVHGLRLLQEAGEVDWLRPGKVTLRAIYNSKNGSRDMLTQALDAYASGPPPPPSKAKPGMRPVEVKRADFLAGIDRLRRTG
jgi:hypothetical protein